MVTPTMSPSTRSSKGLVWAGAWIDTSLFVGINAQDDLDAYTDNTDINGLEGGSGFAAAWVDNTLG